MSAGVPSLPGFPGGRSSRGFGWPRDVTPAERKSLIAGGLGWMLDAMDVMLYSLVLTYLIREFGMSTRTAGFLNSLTLVASAIGGFLFGILADRIGRSRALMASILVYSFAGGACKRVDEDRSHERACAPDAIRENTEKKSADGGSDKRQRIQKTRGPSVHAELADQVRENERVEHDVHGVEHPAEAAGDERFALGGSDVARPPESPRGAAARKAW